MSKFPPFYSPEVLENPEVVAPVVLGYRGYQIAQGISELVDSSQEQQQFQEAARQNTFNAISNTGSSGGTFIMRPPSLTNRSSSSSSSSSTPATSVTSEGTFLIPPRARNTTSYGSTDEDKLRGVQQMGRWIDIEIARSNARMENLRNRKRRRQEDIKRTIDDLERREKERKEIEDRQREIDQDMNDLDPIYTADIPASVTNELDDMYSTLDEMENEPIPSNNTIPIATGVTGGVISAVTSLIDDIRQRGLPIAGQNPNLNPPNTTNPVTPNPPITPPAGTPPATQPVVPPNITNPPITPPPPPPPITPVQPTTPVTPITPITPITTPITDIGSNHSLPNPPPPIIPPITSTEPTVIVREVNIPQTIPTIPALTVGIALGMIVGTITSTKFVYNKIAKK